MESKNILGRLIKNEFRKVCSINLIIVILGVIGVAVLDTFEDSLLLFSGYRGLDVYYYWFNSFSYGGFYSNYFIPMLSTLPYAILYCDEKKKGMDRMIFGRSGIKKYSLAKMIVAFFSGGISLASGALAYIVLLKALLPFCNEENVRECQKLPYVHYFLDQDPIRYFVIMVYFIFLLGAFWSVIATLVAVCFPNKQIVVTAPFLFSFFITRISVMLKIPDEWRLEMWIKARSCLGTEQNTLIMAIVCVLLITCLCTIIFAWKVNQKKGESYAA